ncbi:hypothetical protein GCM10023317_30330 [Actinopolymorpha pittospori]
MTQSGCRSLGIWYGAGAGTSINSCSEVGGTAQEPAEQPDTTHTDGGHGADEHGREHPLPHAAEFMRPLTPPDRGPSAGSRGRRRATHRVLGACPEVGVGQPWNPGCTRQRLADKMDECTKP